MRHFFGSVFVQEDDHIELEYYIQENSAYPENLPEYVEDYLYEKRTNELMGDAVINA